MEWLIFWIFCAVIAAVIAGTKGRSGGGWFCLGLLVGPFAWIVAVLPPMVDAAGPTKVCPFCAEAIRLEALKCRYCQSELPPRAWPQATAPPDLCELAQLSPAQQTEAAGYVQRLDRGDYTIIRREAAWDIHMPHNSIVHNVRTLAALRAITTHLCGR